MKIFFFFASWALTLAALASLFAYAAFDYMWWVPIARDFHDADRSLLLFLLHVAALGAGPVVTAIIMEMEK